MNSVAIVFLAYLAIDSGSSSAFSENNYSPLKKNYTTEELGTCPMNSSISVKVFRNLRGEWLTTFVARNKLPNFIPSMDLNLDKNVIECGDSRYIRISDFLKDTDADNSSKAIVGDYRNNTDGEAYVSCKRINELTAIAEDNASQTRTALQIMEQRMKSLEKTFINFEKTQYNINETLINFEKSQSNITETLISFESTQTSFQKTLTNIEQIVNEMRVILNSTMNFETEDKEKVTCIFITKAKAQMTFDSLVKGKNVKLSSDLRTATRTRPTENAGYCGSVVSNSLLEEDKVFQISINETMDLWSYIGIAIGVIEEKKEGIKDSYFIYGSRNIQGIWAIYSDSESEYGKSHTWKDGNRITLNGYPLPTTRLPKGTLLGVSRRKNGDLHFYLNGVDKGVAFGDVPKDVYAFVDIINYVTKISIVS